MQTPRATDAEMNSNNVESGSSFGAVLRRYRVRAELSQESLAERARIGVATVSTLERGTRHAPHRETVLRLAEALRLPTDDRTELMAASRRPQSPRLRRFLGDAIEGAAVLPLQLSSLVGRDTVVREVAALVAERRLVTLVGAGGVGKTRVALQVAENLSSVWRDGVRLAELAAIGDTSLVAGAIAQALGVRETPNQPLLQTIINSVKRRRFVLVLDNCEHVIEEVSRIVFAILRECEGVHVLATSQESLKVTGERTYRVPALACPAKFVMRALDVADYPAVALFVDRTEASGVAFSLGDDNAEHVGEICRRLDGIPLAIELAAARVKQFAPRQMASLLDDRFCILTSGDRTAPSRQQTMEATLSWSYGLLLAPEKLLFDRLSTFAAACSLETASAVCAGESNDQADVLKLLSSLVDKSLVVSEDVGGETRYRLLESSRQYGRERLHDRGETEKIAARHAAAYLKVANHFEEVRRSVNACANLDHVSAFLDAVEREQPNFMAAVAWAFSARGDKRLGQQLAAARIWGARIAEPLRLLQLALDASDFSTSPQAMAALEHRMAHHLEQRHEFSRALAAAMLETAILEEFGRPSDLASSKLDAAMILLRLGRVDEAETLAQDASVSIGAGDDRRLLALMKDTFANVHFAREAYCEGRSLHAEALQLFRFECDGLRAAICEMNLAEQEFGSGNAHSALAHSRRAIPVLRAWRHAYLAECLSNDATFLIALDRFDEAQARALESLNVAFQTLADAPANAIHAVHRLAAIAALSPSTEPATALEERLYAAQLFGYADARLAAEGTLRCRTDQRDVDRAMASLAHALGENEVASLMSDGAEMSDDEAVELALRLAAWPTTLSGPSRFKPNRSIAP